MKKRGSRWVPILELEPDPSTGKRRQRQGGSYRTKREAQEASPKWSPANGWPQHS